MARYLSPIKIKLSRTYKLYGTAGTYTFTTPNDVDSLDVAVWGGGGNSKSISVYNCCETRQTGAGGGFACGTVGTSSGKQWTVVVGDSQGSSSFGTALSATGATCFNPGVGCVCSTASVVASVTACGGAGCCACGSCTLQMGSGAASGSPYGNGAPGSPIVCYEGKPGGGGWGPTSCGSISGYCGVIGGGYCCQGGGGGGGGAGFPAYYGGGGGTAGTGTAKYCTASTICNYVAGVCFYVGGPARNGTLGSPLFTYMDASCVTRTFGEYIEATDKNPIDPFLRIDNLQGGGGAGGSIVCYNSCQFVCVSKIGKNGGPGGGGGGGLDGFGCDAMIGGDGGIGGGGGGGTANRGGCGGFGGGAGAGNCPGAPGCGGGAAIGQPSGCQCWFGGQGAVLIAYDK